MDVDKIEISFERLMFHEEEDEERFKKSKKHYINITNLYEIL